MVDALKYRYDFFGLSTDDKPTAIDSNEVVDGSTFYEVDTSKYYIYCQGTWYEKTGEEPTPPTPPTPVEDWGSITYLDENDTEQTVELESAEDVLNLCERNSSSYTITIGEVEISNEKITKVNLGTSVNNIGNYFLGYLADNVEITAPNLAGVGDSFLAHCGKIKKLELPKLIIIGGAFLSSSKIDCDVVLPKTKLIKNYFISGSTFSAGHKVEFVDLQEVGKSFLASLPQGSANFTLDLGTKITKIDNAFLGSSYGFNSDITLPASLTSISATSFLSARDFTSKVICECPSSSIGTSNNAFSTTTSSDPIYATGFVFAGTYKSDWKTQFPDRSSSPYRKSRLES